MLKTTPIIRGALLISLLAIMLFVPLIVTSWHASIDKYHDQVLATYECPVNDCAADFDGDGSAEQVIINKDSQNTVYGSLSVVRNDGRELLRLPYRHIDYTLRTHVAIRTVSGKNHLIVYDQIRESGPSANGIYGWVGTQMELIPASEEDKEVLRAMDARDDAGSYMRWVKFRLFKGPVLLCYYLLIGIFIWCFRSFLLGFISSSKS